MKISFGFFVDRFVRDALVKGKSKDVIGIIFILL